MTVIQPLQNLRVKYKKIIITENFITSFTTNTNYITLT